MSDMPFGFGPEDSRDPRDPDRRNLPEDTGGGNADPANPFAAFGAGGFDVGALGQMLTQLGQMLSQGAASGGGGPVNYDLAKQMAVQKLSTTGLPSAQQAAAITDAVRLAELWLDPATALPTGTQSSAAWAPRDWVERTLPTWQRLCDPVARRMAGSWIDALPSEVRQNAGPLVAMVEQMGGMAFGSQLGSALAQLGGEVLTSTDIGLPLGPLGVAALLPASIERFATGLERKSSEVIVFLAAREAAHHRLFAHVPWLRQRLLGTIEEFARGIQIDTDALQEIASQIDPTDPQSMDQLMASGLLEQRTSPEQKAALARLEVLLALVEGWVCPVPMRCARRCGGGAPPGVPPSRPSPLWLAWNCGRASSGRPPRCGENSPSSRVSRAGTPCGATPICCLPPRTWTIPRGSSIGSRAGPPIWMTRSRR
jgi:putative hydrolase